MKLLQSHILMDAHYHDFVHFSLSPFLVMPVDFNCPGLSDETEHRQGAGISFFISNNIEPLECSFHLVLIKARCVKVFFFLLSLIY